VVTQYEAGQRFAYKVRDDLHLNGYKTATTAGSKGAADIWAAKPGQLLFVQAKKRDGQLPPKERLALINLAAYCYSPACPTLAIVAFQPVPRGPLHYRRLVGVGPGDWEPWTPDEVRAA
jgi:hypothetical protein